jgi:excisionase family DNA binding protein
MDEQSQQPRTLTVDEAARAAGLSRVGYYAAARRGDVPALRVGRRILVPRAQFERFVSGDPNWRNPKLGEATACGST